MPNEWYYSLGNHGRVGGCERSFDNAGCVGWLGYDLLVWKGGVAGKASYHISPPPNWAVKENNRLKQGTVEPS